jgi:phosphate transport system permease protein
MKSENRKAYKDRPKGEVFVWVTGLGLATGLAMIAGLLGLILYNGVGVFWPKPVAEIVLSDEGESHLRGSRVVSGVVVREKAIDPRDQTLEQRESADANRRREKQLFVGNRETYGVSFAYFNVGDIVEIRYPKEIIHAERMEWGDALLYPLRLILPDGSSVAVEEPAFRDTLKRKVEEVQSRRATINDIERRQIGKINFQIRDLELDKRYLSRLPERTAQQEAQLASITERLDELQAVYDPLAIEASSLRARQHEVMLEYRLSTGHVRTAPLGEFVHYYYPNQLNILQKLGLFLYHLWDFVSGYPREANTEGGIWPAIFGTFIMTLLMSVAVTPFGVLAAIYLREYAKQGLFVRSVRIAVNNLAGVPSIVFGIFGLGFFVYFMGGSIDRLFFSRSVELGTPTFGTGGVLWASLTLALMTVPVVIVATEEALAAVSRGVREGSLACGASKWQTIQRLVLPAAAPGILTGLILAMARGAGEVAPLILVGVVAFAPNLPVDSLMPFIHLERKFMHLGFHIYDLGFQSPDSEAAQPMVFATTLILILLVIVLNLSAILIRNHLRRKYAASAF